MDNMTRSQRSRTMARIKSKNTVPEIFVRKIIFRLGFRYRIHQRRLPGNPDIAFASKKKVIFVHGCFWHSHKNCKKSTSPKSNTAYWIQKLKENTARDLYVKKQYKSMGWSLLVIWECQLDDPQRLETRINKFLSKEQINTTREPPDNSKAK